MNVLMFTNTFVPHVGGVTRSVLTLKRELERRGHRVLVVAPSYEGHRQDEPGVLRVPSVQHLAGKGYATPIPMSRRIRDEIEAFGPDIIHTHHPFLLGDTGLRTAASLGVPSVYTAHTRYDFYLGPAAAKDGRLARMMRELTCGFSNIADAVIAPSESMRDLLRKGGVIVPVQVVPTGIDLARLGAGDRAGMRAQLGLGPEDFLVGHLGRLADEKNLDFLAEAVVRFLVEEPRARFVVAGTGPKREAMRAAFTDRGLGDRLILLGHFDPSEVAACYAAMDVFAFASLSETQGLVVAEAMAAGTPVVALDAPGVRESLAFGGGTLLPSETGPDGFAKALAAVAGRSASDRATARAGARQAAQRFSIASMGDAVEALYHELITAGHKTETDDSRAWEANWKGIATEADLVENMLRAIGTAVAPEPAARSTDWEAGHAGRGLAVAALSFFWAALLRAWRASWRVDARQEARLDAEIAAGAPIIALFWHGNYLPLFPLMAGHGALVATSRSFRGAVIAGIARRFGYRTVQVGPATGKASDCLRAELARPGGMVAIAADGPLGPRHEVKPGAIAIAARTGAKIMPVAAIPSARIRIASRWDLMELPLPFSRVELRVGKAIAPATIGETNVEAEAAKIGARLLALRPDL